MKWDPNVLPSTCLARRAAARHGGLPRGYIGGTERFFPLVFVDSNRPPVDGGGRVLGHAPAGVPPDVLQLLSCLAAALVAPVVPRYALYLVTHRRHLVAAHSCPCPIDNRVRATVCRVCTSVRVVCAM